MIFNVAGEMRQQQVLCNCASVASSHPPMLKYLPMPLPMERNTLPLTQFISSAWTTSQD